MRELISRFSLDAIKFNGQVLACMILIWIVVVGCTISSINHQSYSAAQRRFWIALVTLVPLLGMLSYLAASFEASKYPELFFWKRFK